MEEKKLVNRYLLTPDIMADFYRINIFYSPFFIAVESFLLLSLASYLIYLLGNPGESWKNFILCAVYAVGVLLLRIFQYHSIFKKYCAANKEPSMVSYTLRENGIRAKNENTEATAFYPYAEIKRCRKTKKLIILTAEDRSCIIINKEAFTADEEADFRTELAMKLPKFTNKIAIF